MPHASSQNRTMPRASEGICAVCREPVSAHVSSSGRWKGCKPGAALGVRLMLVADRRGKRAMAYAPAVEQRAVPTIHTVPQTAQTVYVAKFPLSHPTVRRMNSERDRGVYRLIAKRRNGATRAAILRDLSTTRTGIADGALRRLVEGGLVERIKI